MNNFVYHSATKAAFERFLKHPPHATIMIGLTGSGKASASRLLAAQLLQCDLNRLDKHPYVKSVAPEDGRAIPIDSIRTLQHFMSLKIPGSTSPVARVAIIEDAHLLTSEAQNALLKTLEEPPLDTVLLLTTNSVEALLPTIQSRARILQLVVPPIDLLKDYFISEGHSQTDIDKAFLVTGGLPGLTHALLASEQSHPLFAATEKARELLKATTYEKLLVVDALAKHRELCNDTLFILGQMARMALMRTENTQATATVRWRRIMKSAYQAQEALRSNANSKLALTHLMLEL